MYTAVFHTRCTVQLHHRDWLQCGCTDVSLGPQVHKERGSFDLAPLPSKMGLFLYFPVNATHRPSPGKYMNIQLTLGSLCVVTFRSH